MAGNLGPYGVGVELLSCTARGPIAMEFEDGAVPATGGRGGPQRRSGEERHEGQQQHRQQRQRARRSVAGGEEPAGGGGVGEGERGELAWLGV